MSARNVEIRSGDCLALLREMQADSVDCVVTSPPYWGLRDYGVDGMIGLEPTMQEHITRLVAVFAEIRRVLKPTGTCWLNYGDAYAAHRGGTLMPAETIAGGVGGKGDAAAERGRPNVGRVPSCDPKAHGLKHKDLMMLPARIALALQDAGWWIRSEIIWHKPNPMPESVTDRPTQSHEKIFLLTKSARYFYDAEAVREGAEVRALSSWSDRAKTEPSRRGDPASSGHRTSTNTLASQTGRNARNVWTISTVAFADAHFATFPPAIAERCIKAGSPKDGIVLDPFGGAGTTGLVAARLGRRAVLLELNPDYAAMARRRIDADWMGPEERRGFLADQSNEPLPLFAAE